MPLFGIALALAASFGAVSADEQRRAYGWSLAQSGDACGASRIYNGNAMLSFAYRPAVDRAIITVVDPKFASIRDDAEYRLSIDFLHNPASATHRWRDVRSHGLRVFDGTPGFQVIISGKELFAALSGSVGLRIERGGKLVGHHVYEGGRDVTDYLRSCRIVGGGTGA